jgi:hypothetical protein
MTPPPRTFGVVSILDLTLLPVDDLGGDRHHRSDHARGLRAGVMVQLDGQPAGPSVAVPPGRYRTTWSGNSDALGVSHRPLFRGVALFHNAERGGSPMRIAADCGQHLLVGLQGFDVLSVR